VVYQQLDYQQLDYLLMTVPTFDILDPLGGSVASLLLFVFGLPGILT
jgi:hypothetical protein